MTATEAVRQGVNRKYPDAVPYLRVYQYACLQGGDDIVANAVIYNHRVDLQIHVDGPIDGITSVQTLSKHLLKKVQELAPLGIRMKHMDTVDQHELMLGILEGEDE